MFYKYRKIPSFNDTITQIEIMYDNFKKEVAKLSLQFAIEIPLPLKIIVHYGILPNIKLEGLKNFMEHQL